MVAHNCCFIVIHSAAASEARRIRSKPAKMSHKKSLLWNAQTAERRSLLGHFFRTSGRFTGLFRCVSMPVFLLRSEDPLLVVFFFQFDLRSSKASKLYSNSEKKTRKKKRETNKCILALYCISWYLNSKPQGMRVWAIPDSFLMFPCV